MVSLVKDKVFPTIARMAVPMLAGTFALNAYNLADTWFVAQLGTDALAAMSFTFPVVMFLGFVTRGLGTGATTVVAHAIGKGNQHAAARLTTHAFFLSTSVASFLAVVGFLTIRPLFVRLGAGEEILLLLKQYMTIWYCGMVPRVIGMMFSDIIIATGRTKVVSLLMVAGTMINFVFDPVLIFGWGGFPVMGIKGAALATVISESLVLIFSFYFVWKRYRLFVLRKYHLKRIFISWRRILYVGIPSMLSSVLTPVSSGVIIKIVSGFGAAAVAAVGVASRIEMFAFMIPMTVGMSLIPFVAQNFGAGRFDRIREALKGTTIFALSYGIFIACLFFAFARPLSGMFSQDVDVLHVLTQYIYITCFGYGFLEVHRYMTFFLTGIHRPKTSAMLTFIRAVVLIIPLSCLGAKFFGLSGVFWGRFLSDICAASVAFVCVREVLKKTGIEQFK